MTDVHICKMQGLFMRTDVKHQGGALSPWQTAGFSYSSYLVTVAVSHIMLFSSQAVALRLKDALERQLHISHEAKGAGRRSEEEGRVGWGQELRSTDMIRRQR